jgi:hypothetical protein
MSSLRSFNDRALKRGGHTLILGWSPLAIEVIRELSIANENVRKPRIVILCTASAAEVSESLNHLELGRQRFQVIQGDPTSVGDLERANAYRAKSIVDLNSDLTDLETRAKAQAAKHPALAVAIDDLLSFDGDEIYFNRLPALDGKTYADAVLAFNSAAVIGFELEGQIQLNPAAKTLLPTGSQVIALAEDDDRVVYTGIREDALAKLDLSKGGVVAQLSKANDGGISISNLKAKLLAQISENPALLGIFENLFDIERPNLGLVSIAEFCEPGKPIEIADLAVAAISRGYSLVGYFDSKTGSVALNPTKAVTITPNQDDAIVVVGSFAA